MSDELARCLHVVNAGLLRFEPDGTGFAVNVKYEPGIATREMIEISGRRGYAGSGIAPQSLALILVVFR